MPRSHSFSDNSVTDETETLVDLSKVLTDFISGGNATFTCGGTIPLADIAKRQSSAAATPGPGPVVIRWDRGNGSVARVALPVTPEKAQSLDDLVSDCQPAGFGHCGKDVLDENVRRASAIDSSRFTTNICPYTLGIAERLTQILLPNAASVARDGLDCGAIIKIEPYKLNVSAGHLLPRDWVIIIWLSARCRYTKDRRASSRHMSIPPAVQHTLDRWSSVSQVLTRAAS